MHEKFCELCGSERSSDEVYLSIGGKEVCYSCFHKDAEEEALKRERKQEERSKVHKIYLANKKRSEGGRE